MAIYELRTYTLYVGKLAEAVALYKSEGMPVLEKYQDKLVGYFTGDIGAAVSTPTRGARSRRPASTDGATRPARALQRSALRPALYEERARWWRRAAFSNASCARSLTARLRMLMSVARSGICARSSS